MSTTGDRVWPGRSRAVGLAGSAGHATVPPPLRRKYDVTSTEFDLPTFADLPLRSELLAVVEELGYTHPSPVQAEAIGPLVDGRDLIGQAATGTGKTAAFALPMLERLAEIRPQRGRGDAPFGMILAPTRELALQVSEAVSRYGARPRRARPHRLRRRARRSAVEGSAVGRRHRRRHAGPRHRPDEPRRAAPVRAGDDRPRRGRRDARHGLRRGHRDPARRHAGHPAGGAVLRDDAAPHRGARTEVPARAGHRPDPPRGGAGGRGAQGPPDRLPRSALHTTAALGPRAGGRASRAPRSCSAAPGSTSTRSPRRSPPAACAPRPCTAAWTRSTAPASSTGCAAAAPSCSSPPTSPPAAWTSTCSPTSSTTTCRSRPRPMCTASAASGGRGAKASRSRWCRRRRSTRCATSSASPASRSTIAAVPTAADLRAARLDRTRDRARGDPAREVDDAATGARRRRAGR